MLATDVSSDALALLLDKQAITEQIYRYCRSVDRLDVPLGHSVFHEDATADYGPKGFKGAGREAIDWICTAHGHLHAHSHQVSNILINVNGDHAGSEAYFSATLRGQRDGKWIHMEIWGRYCDTWSNRDGVWRIDHREAVIDYDSMREVSPMGNHDRGRRDSEDLSYAALGAGA